MAIDFDCPRCGKKLFAQDRFAGTSVVCPDCQTTLTVPQAREAPLVLENGPVKPGASEPELVEGGISGPRGLSEGAAGPIPATGQAGPAGGESDLDDRREQLCPQCGGDLSKEAMFCSNCGMALERQGEGSGNPEDQVIRRGKVDFSKALEAGISAFSQDWHVAGPINLIYPFIIMGAILVIFFLLPFPTLILLGLLPFFLFLPFLRAGFDFLGLRLADRVSGRKVNLGFGDLFRGFQKTAAIGGAFFILMIPIMVINHLLSPTQPFAPLPPGKLALNLVAQLFYTWLMIRLIFVNLLILDRDCGIMTAYKTSWRLTKGNMLNIFLAWLLSWLIGLLGFFLCCVGFAFSMIIPQATLGSLYRQATSAGWPDSRPGMGPGEGAA